VILDRFCVAISGADLTARHGRIELIPGGYPAVFANIIGGDGAYRDCTDAPRQRDDSLAHRILYAVQRRYYLAITQLIHSVNLSLGDWSYNT
jgi:hypothetical protein